jgi:hypothetical protein
VRLRWRGSDAGSGVSICTFVLVKQYKSTNADTCWGEGGAVLRRD